MDEWKPGTLATVLRSARLRLEPTTVDHAYGLALALADPGLYEHIGGAPRPAAEWRAVLAGWSARRSPDGSQWWLNWVVVRETDNDTIGWVQATAAETTATVAYMIGTPWQGVGYATEAVRTLIEHLRAAGTRTFGAFIGPGNVASQAVVRRLGFRKDSSVIQDGEEYYLLRTPGRS